MQRNGSIWRRIWRNQLRRRLRVENHRQKKRKAASRAPGEGRHPTPGRWFKVIFLMMRVFYARVNTLVTFSTGIVSLRCERCLLSWLQISLLCFSQLTKASLACRRDLLSCGIQLWGRSVGDVAFFFALKNSLDSQNLIEWVSVSVHFNRSCRSCICLHSRCWRIEHNQYAEAKG